MAERDRAAGSGGAALSADRAVAAVRAHLDRVHDAVLRTGCTSDDAVEVVRATALALVERSAVEPASPDEAVGRWFADAEASGRQAARPSSALPGDDRQQRLQSALDALQDEQRLAVLLRDAYDLPLPAVAADDPTLGSYPVRVWSSPIVRDGLVYVVDIRNGLYVLRYTGPGASEVAAAELVEGNAS